MCKTGMEILWTNNFSSSSRILTLSDETNWTVVYNQQEGDGGYDEISLFESYPRRRVRYIRIHMIRSLHSWQDTIGIYEISLFGCGQSNTSSFPGIIKALSHTFRGLSSLTPTVSRLQPTIGSTAGGTRVTLHGFLWTQDSLSARFGGIPCQISSLDLTNPAEQTAICTSGAAGITNGGLKYVEIFTGDSGASVPSKSIAFWYIDAWSAFSTWGGNSPPVGCGAYAIDSNCQESVVIPAGQVVLLDVSPPRLFLLLIQGTLIFDRRDLHIQVRLNFSSFLIVFLA